MFSFIKNLFGVESKQAHRNSRRSMKRRVLRMEGLERRDLMAGNVLISVSLGDLVVTGDTQDNDLQIIQARQDGVPTPGRYWIAPQNGTTINGQSSGRYVNDVTHDMRINLGAGNDDLTLSDGSSDANFIVPNDLVISMGGGNDDLTVNHVKVRDDVSITTGDGNDDVLFRGSVGADRGLDSGANDLSIDSGAGADWVGLEHAFVRRNLTVTTGIDNSNDLVNIEFASVGNNTNISTGGGSDIVDLDDSGFNKRLTINAGDGDDGVWLHRCHVDELFAYLGTGDDIAELEGTSGRRATLSGDSGIDALTRTDSPFSEFFQASSF